MLYVGQRRDPEVEFVLTRRALQRRTIPDEPLTNGVLFIDQRLRKLDLVRRVDLRGITADRRDSEKLRLRVSELLVLEGALLLRGHAPELSRVDLCPDARGGVAQCCGGQ